MQRKEDGTVDRRTLKKDAAVHNEQWLPTKNGFVQMVFRPVKIVNGCVSTKK